MKNREIIQIVHTRTEDGYELFKTCLRKSNQEDLVNKLTELETILSQEEQQSRDPVILPGLSITNYIQATCYLMIDNL